MLQLGVVLVSWLDCHSSRCIHLAYDEEKHPNHLSVSVSCNKDDKSNTWSCEASYEIRLLRWDDGPPCKYVSTGELSHITYSVFSDIWHSYSEHLRFLRNVSYDIACRLIVIIEMKLKFLSLQKGGIMSAFHFTLLRKLPPSPLLSQKVVLLLFEYLEFLFIHSLFLLSIWCNVHNFCHPKVPFFFAFLHFEGYW